MEIGTAATPGQTESTLPALLSRTLISTKASAENYVVVLVTPKRL